MVIGKGHKAGGGGGLVCESIADLEFSYLRYGKHSRHRIGIWEQRRPMRPNARYWIIFIHGGAWRDPRNKPTDFVPTIKHLMAAGTCPETVRGFISIDYRLSPYADEFPQCLEQTPVTEQRTAQHPDHIHDVRAAMLLVGKRFDLDGNYLVVGHSAGATLAFQLLMTESSWQLPTTTTTTTTTTAALRTATTTTTTPFPRPAALIGVSGIYDLVGLNRRFDDRYAGFMANAFGHDQQVWRAASPATYHASFAQASLLPRSTPLWLAISPDDGLLDVAETLSMADKLAADGFRPVVVDDLYGEHDFVWQDGSQLALLVRRVLAKLSSDVIL